MYILPIFSLTYGIAYCILILLILDCILYSLVLALISSSI